MYSISLIIPDFAIILLGLVLSRKGGFTKAFWDGAEKLVFNFLLAPFLFVSVAQSQLAVGESVRFLLTGICAMLLGRQLPAFFYSLPRGSLKTATIA